MAGAHRAFPQDFLQYTNHVGLCTEEISAAGEACVHSLCFALLDLSEYSFSLGNAVQGFT